MVGLSPKISPPTKKVTFSHYKSKKLTQRLHRDKESKIRRRSKTSTYHAASASIVQKISSTCSSMSDNMYLHHIHDRVAKVIYEELVSQNDNEKGKLKHIVTPPTVTHIDGKEI